MISKNCLLYVLGCLIVIGCSRGEEKSAPVQPQQSAPPGAQKSEPAAPPMVAHESQTPTKTETSGSTGTAAGVEWTVPATWQTQPARSMRIATYTIPKAADAIEDGECGVFFFGSGQGGDVRSNIDRWVSQFESPGKPEESQRTVNGIPVTIVKINGTYLSPGGPMMQSQGSKANYKLLGAIVEAPQGAVFFKATGPDATMKAAESDFNALVDSVRKQAI